MNVKTNVQAGPEIIIGPGCRALLILAVVMLTFAASAAADDCVDHPNPVDYAMYFLGDVRDFESCDQQFVDGRWVTPDNVSNPAMTCPDMFSWRLYINVVRDQFWSRWADEQQNWPLESNDAPCPTLSSLPLSRPREHFLLRQTRRVLPRPVRITMRFRHGVLTNRRNS